MLVFNLTDRPVRLYRHKIEAHGGSLEVPEIRGDAVLPRDKVLVDAGVISFNKLPEDWDVVSAKLIPKGSHLLAL